MSVLSSLDELHEHYGNAGEASLIKEIDSLSPSYRKIVESSSFCALTTCGPEGLDCSPPFWLLVAFEQKVSAQFFKDPVGILKEVIDDSDDGMSHGDCRPFRATACPQAMELGGQVGLFGARSSPGGFHQG